LAKDLAADGTSLLGVLERCGDWKPETDAKLEALFNLLGKKHPTDKVIVFTQFADTARYLKQQLRARGIKRLAGVTGDDENPTSYAWRFSPISSQKRDQIRPEQELRVLVSTDVLSEGQNPAGRGNRRELRSPLGDRIAENSFRLLTDAV